jgi:hypothetical protein
MRSFWRGERAPSELQRALDALGVALASVDREAAAYWRRQIAELGQARTAAQGASQHGRP